MSREWTTALTRRFVVGCLLVGVAQASLGQGVASAQPVPAAVVPAAVVPAVAVPAKSRSTSNIRPIPSDKLVVNVNPNLPKKRGWRVKIERLDGGKWRKVCKCRTKGRWERVVLTQPPGKYRARVLPRKGYRTARARTTFTYIPTAAKATTVPATTGNPNPPAAQVASFTGSPLWSADFETGDLSQFASTPWNNVPLAPRITTTAQSGRYAGQYTIPAGGSRSENITTINNGNHMFTEGDDRWFSFATQLGADVPLNTTNWQVFAQWKNDGYGSPPLAMNISKGMWQIGGGYGYPGSLVSEPGGNMTNNSSRDLGPATSGTWDDWMVHIVFSSTSATSLVEVWRNGQQVVSNFKPTVGTLYPNLDSYMKIGYYRSTAINQDSTIRLDNIRIGTTPTSIN